MPTFSSDEEPSNVVLLTSEPFKVSGRYHFFSKDSKEPDEAPENGKLEDLIGRKASVRSATSSVLQIGT